MKIYRKIDELVGKTPLFEAVSLKKQLNLKANLYLKLEYFNPAGSVKDRIAVEMLDDAEKRNVIKSGATIIEPTSGNTGIGLAMIGASRGYKVILTMPDTMSVERIKFIKAYGAEVVLTDGKKGMQGAIDKAIEINKQTPNSFIPSQFTNYSAVDAHYKTTGKEIFNDLDGKVDVFVATVGSGSTFSGSVKYLKEQNKFIKAVAVEPEDSPLISKGISGVHKIQGIGANFIPEILDLSLIDEVKTANYQKSLKFARFLAKTEGILVGISSGAALSVAIDLAKLDENTNKNIVVILPDSGSRYVSTELFD